MQQGARNRLVLALAAVLLVAAAAPRPVSAGDRPGGVGAIGAFTAGARAAPGQLARRVGKHPVWTCAAALCAVGLQFAEVPVSKLLTAVSAGQVGLSLVRVAEAQRKRDEERCRDCCHRAGACTAELTLALVLGPLHYLESLHVPEAVLHVLEGGVHGGAHGATHGPHVSQTARAWATVVALGLMTPQAPSAPVLRRPHALERVVSPVSAEPPGSSPAASGTGGAGRAATFPVLRGR